MPACDITSVRFLVPGNPNQNTGGYRYVRRLVSALVAEGFSAEVSGMPGQFPRPDTIAAEALDQALSGCPDHGVVVLDGLAMGGLPDVVAKHAERLNLVALVHHPLADESGLPEADRDWLFNKEREGLGHVRAVITTSPYTATRLADYGVSPTRIGIAEPAVDEVFIDALLRRREQPAPCGEPLLLCVAHLSPRKAQHQLVKALSSLGHLPWRCALAGSLERDAGYAREVVDLIESRGLVERFELTGELDDSALVAQYRRADAFVFPSLYEGYGMAVDEALAAGLPVLCSDGGALSRMAGRRGAVVYPAGDIAAMAGALERWLTIPEALAVDRRSAEAAANDTRGWRATAGDFLAALQGLSRPDPDSLFDMDWLVAREPADHRARSVALTDRLDRWLRKRREETPGDVGQTSLAMADIGSGLASNPLYLSSRLSVPQAWHLIEQDERLLRMGLDRMRECGESVTAHNVLLTARDVDDALPLPLDLLTASALIDLVSETWLESLARAIARRKAAVLVVLSYSGVFELLPADVEDARLKALVNTHQHRDKGSGAALGPEATDRLRQLLLDEGYRVQVENSPWQLDGQDSGLVEALLRGWVNAALEQEPESAVWLDAWLDRRIRQLKSGGLRVRVEHLDLLALPADQRRG